MQKQRPFQAKPGTLSELCGRPLGLAVAYVELGRLDEARAEVAEFMRLSPKVTLEGDKRAQEHGVEIPTQRSRVGRAISCRHR